MACLSSTEQGLRTLPPIALKPIDLPIITPPSVLPDNLSIAPIPKNIAGDPNPGRRPSRVLNRVHPIDSTIVYMGASQTCIRAAAYSVSSGDEIVMHTSGPFTNPLLQRLYRSSQ